MNRKEKLRNRNGETLLEGLLAILLVVMSVSILCGFMLASSRLGNAADTQETSAVYRIFIRQGGAYQEVEAFPIMLEQERMNEE